MTRNDNVDGGYVLTADAGRELVIKNDEGAVVARAKEVFIPTANTLYTWVEIIEDLPEPVNEEVEKAAKIAALEAELAKLKGAE